MRWISKHIDPPKPQGGDYKIEYRFAWWPKKIGNVVVWLESYKRIFEFKVRLRRHYFPGYPVIEVTGGGWDLVQEKPMNPGENKRQEIRWQQTENEVVNR